ncbi:hypothetical protein MLD38_002426 [Melastoma candidum]|uniref:Uncharacterized protein n=1 Tax=Melastoma candidum TaxID=119954 RepID=A0ACB9S2D0_9MYRT|nr:hypothetical protein MLD38_002426 [Melastoma candidum]
MAMPRTAPPENNAKNLFHPLAPFFLLTSVTFLATSSADLTIPVTHSVFSGGGRWSLVTPSIGVSAMHIQLLPSDHLLIFDRTDFGRSNLSLPPPCPSSDCTAHSLLFDIEANFVRPLALVSDTWCSSGALLPSGSLLQTGGYLSGDKKVRTFPACPDHASPSCVWTELNHTLVDRRWYASNQLLPDGRVFVLGGRNVFTYEFVPKSSPMESSFFLPFLKVTRDAHEENNLYPFIHLLPDGNLFIFANRQSILFDYKKGRVVREYPFIPGPDKRNYPSTGSSVLLPMRLHGSDLPAAEVMVCGGAPRGSYTKAQRLKFYVQASTSCGRLRVMDPSPRWAMEEMPLPRVMSDMLLLPDGNVLIINGATNGTAGWEDATGAIFNPVMYSPYQPDPSLRFRVLSPNRIPRMYHSAAVLVPDGRVFVGGSNPHNKYNFTSHPYPTELSLEAFSPPYLGPQFAILRPSILSIEAPGQTLTYRQSFAVNFVLMMFVPERGLSIGLLAPPFTTHSFGMNQRLLFLEATNLEHHSGISYKVTAAAPQGSTVAPPGNYLLFVVHGEIPSRGLWMKVQSDSSG